MCHWFPGWILPKGGYLCKQTLCRTSWNEPYLEEPGNKVMSHIHKTLHHMREGMISSARSNSIPTAGIMNISYKGGSMDQVTTDPQGFWLVSFPGLLRLQFLIACSIFAHCKRSKTGLGKSNLVFNLARFTVRGWQRLASYPDPTPSRQEAHVGWAQE